MSLMGGHAVARTHPTSDIKLATSSYVKCEACCSAGNLLLIFYGARNESLIKKYLKS